ncbi:hypothetical protein BCR33DRAFT_719009 [Rhizoclosmatium globosum]|uniref:Rho-GAP domain-containing protein n=1 Tax=Rhizoclosmatium globosum TaxID=329046 RepID=A0A1Y2C3D8_9FUNG|nr:hypothetical protein BCR33DRAFT_719009 [Rhizoclosmatium globosum]|eukprot:ORY41407.1 hypothetical protein BCR33DRAFT_719009 [Rhizoclosmatium globosum]
MASLQPSPLIQLLSSPYATLSPAQNPNQSFTTPRRRQLSTFVNSPNRRSVPVPVEESPAISDVPNTQIRGRSLSLSASASPSSAKFLFKALLASTKSISRQSKRVSDSAENSLGERNSGVDSPNSCDSYSSSENSSSDDFAKTKGRRSGRQSISQLIANTFTSGSRPQTPAVTKSNDFPPPPPLPIKSSTVEQEGPIFNTTIQQASGLGCKNGIPDIVVQCRVKEWAIKFGEAYLTRRSELNRKQSVRKSFTREQSVLRRRVSVTSKTKESQPTQSLSNFQTNFSLIAASGSHASMPEEHRSNNSSRSSINNSIISLKHEESRRGVGMWGNDGLLSTMGFPVALDNETPATIANSIAVANGNNQPSAETIEKIRFELEKNCPSREHLHTFSYFVLHLQRVAEQASTNMMTPKNLAICIFVTAKEGGEYVIRFADLIFGNIDLVGRETVASLPFSETTSLFPELEDDPADLPRWDSTIDDVEPRLMRQWFENFVPSLAPTPKTPSSAGFRAPERDAVDAAADFNTLKNHLNPIRTRLAELNNDASAITTNSLVVINYSKSKDSL